MEKIHAVFIDRDGRIGDPSTSFNVGGGAEGIILGCTEIVKPEGPIFDTTKLHAIGAVLVALGNSQDLN